MLVTLFGITMLVSESQSKNAAYPILVTLLGMEYVVAVLP